MIKILDDLAGKWEKRQSPYNSHDLDGAFLADGFIFGRKDCATDLRAAIPVVDAELLRWKKAVESLTPSGSEYVGDPKACAEFIQGRWNIAHEIALENVKRRQAIEAQQKELVEALTNLEAICERTCQARGFLCCGNYNSINEEDHIVIGCPRAKARALLTRVKEA